MAVAAHTEPIPKSRKGQVSLYRIRLDLAGMPCFTTGSAWHGYEFVAPLAADGHIDLAVWNQVKEICRVIRFWNDDPEEHGQFLHDRGGWCFKYPAGSEVERETIFTLDRNRLTPGGYVTVTEPDGEQRPFRVVAMTPALMNS